MIRRPLVALLLLLSCLSTASAQQATEAKKPTALPNGHFRIKSIETASTSNVVVIEGVVEAPAGSVIGLGSETAGGGFAGSQSTLVAAPGEPLPELRFIVMLDRLGLNRIGGQPPRTENGCTFSIITRSPHSRTSSMASTVVPDDKKLDTVLVPLLKAGDFPGDEAVEVFRFQDKTYSIRLNP